MAPLKEVSVESILASLWPEADAVPSQTHSEMQLAHSQRLYKQLQAEHVQQQHRCSQLQGLLDAERKQVQTVMNCLLKERHACAEASTAHAQELQVHKQAAEDTKLQLAAEQKAHASTQAAQADEKGQLERQLKAEVQSKADTQKACDEANDRATEASRACGELRIKVQQLEEQQRHSGAAPSLKNESDTKEKLRMAAGGEDC